MIDHSIPGLACAKQILASSERITVVRQGSIEAHARITDSGSIALTLRVVPPQTYHHTTPIICQDSRRYISGTIEQRRNAINSAFTKLLRRWGQERQLHDARERLYRLTESRVVPDNLHESPPISNTQDYASMSVDDIKAWMPIIESWPVKPDAS